MKQPLLKILFLWLLVCFSIEARAQEYPSSLYMEQTSFSATGRATATQSSTEEGVYEFTFISSNYGSPTTAPRNWIFSTATSTSTAKNDNYVTYGASAITDLSNVQPEFGKVYKLYKYNSSDVGDKITSQAVCSFRPLYWSGAEITVKVNLKEETVVFNAEEPEVKTLGLFDKSSSTILASTTVKDGKAYYSLRLGQDYSNLYFAANAENRAGTNSVQVWGSSDQVSPKIQELEINQSYPLVRTTYYEVYTASTCSFSAKAGLYDVVVDLEKGTVEFKEFEGNYLTLPETLYLRNNGFGTAYDQSDGVDGVYKFAYSSTSTSTDVFLVFSDATSLANARKSAWVLGSSSEDKMIQPEFGKEYDLYFVDPDNVSSNKYGTFLPIYPQSYQIEVNLNTMKVKFNLTSPEEEVTQLALLHYGTTNALQVADMEENGIAHYSVKIANDTPVYFAANCTKRADSSTKAIWGASDSANPQLVNIQLDVEQPLYRTSYKQVYSGHTCSFQVPAGDYDITVDIEKGTVKFESYTGKYAPKPATLYLATNAFGSRVAATGENGIYKYPYDKSGSYTSTPFTIIFTDVTSAAAAASSTWTFGATLEDKNIVPEPGKIYDLVPLNIEKATATDYTGVYMPLYPANYDITVDLNEKTVVFDINEEITMDELNTINLLDNSGSFRMVSTADKAEDGKFYFSTHALEGTKFALSTASTKAEMQDPSRYNFGASGHAHPADVALEIGKKYTAQPTTYRRLYTDGIDYFVLPGMCDLVFDPETRELTVSEYTGKYDPLPTTLYLKSSALSTTYEESEGVDGVYTFEYTTQAYNNAPRNLIFTDATTSTVANITGMNWVVGAKTEDGSPLVVYPGMVTPLQLVTADAVKSQGESFFTPFHPWTYNITVDLKNMTATWGEPVDAPQTLYLLDDSMGNYGGQGGFNGVYEYEFTTYSSHPLFISDATNTTDLRSTPWIFVARPYNDGSGYVDIQNGGTTSLTRGTYYQAYSYTRGVWKTPEGINKIKATLDINNNTISWSYTPVETREIEVLYLVNRDLNTLAKSVNYGSNEYDYEFTLKSSTYVAFTDADTETIDAGRVFYGSSVPYGASYQYVTSGKEYPVYRTSQEGVTSNKTDFYLVAGTYKAHVDMNNNTVTFENISRGGTWYVPEAINLVDDDLNVIATCDASDEGVFTFNNVEIKSDSKIVKVVFQDKGENAQLFGANADGKIGPNVEPGRNYELYLTDNLYVVTDGASCFGLTPSTYNITVDFVEQQVRFVDPTIPVYPERVYMMMPAEDPDDDDSYWDYENENGPGNYWFVVKNSEDITIYLQDSDTGVKYGAEEENPEVADGAEISLVESQTPNNITIPAGNWNIYIDLVNMNVKVEAIPDLTFVDTTMPEGTEFPSYFGNGKATTAEFSFSNPIYNGNVYVVLGDYTGGTPAASNTTAIGTRGASVDDNKIILDFRGYTYIIPEEATNKEYVHIVFTNIRDYNNTYLTHENPDYPGLPSGSIVFKYPYEEFQRIAIEGKYELESESNIDEVETITLHVNHFDEISFNSINFGTVEYYEEEVQIPAPKDEEDDDQGDDNSDDQGDNNGDQGDDNGGDQGDDTGDDQGDNNGDQGDLDQDNSDDNGSGDAEDNTQDETDTDADKDNDADQSDSDTDSEGDNEAEEEEEEMVTVTVTREKVTKVATLSYQVGKTDDEGYTEINVKIPMSVRGMGRLKLYFDGLTIDDNYTDHLDDVKAYYITEVDPMLIVTSDPADGSTLASIEEITLTWPHVVISSVGHRNSIGYFENIETGEKVKAVYTYPLDDNQIVVTPLQTITAKGTYELCINEGDLVINDDREALNKEIKLSYSVDGTLGVNGLLDITDEDTVTVVNLQGVMVRKGKGKETLEGLDGIYIVNGVKCLLRSGK